jgi:predicted amino acid dehydrogenase
MDSSEQEIATAVGRLLREQNEEWDVPPAQAQYSSERIMQRAGAILSATQMVSGSSNYLGVEQAFGQTQQFVDNAFGIYKGRVKSRRYKWVFAVPGRVEDSAGNEYASEVTPFLPILDPRYGVDARTTQFTTTSLAPSVIETYVGRDGEKGAVVWTPLHVNAEARTDAESWRKFAVENTKGIRRSVDQMAGFALKRLGAQVMGLGASLPSFTQFGKTIKQEGLVTTTGHAGTVHLLNETVRHVIETQGMDEQTIGLLGAGSIGSAWAELILQEKEGHRVSVYDRNSGQVDNLRQKVDAAQVDVHSDELSVLRSAAIIVSAITETLDLDELERSAGERIDLSGKIIIDDSQPGAFDRAQVEDRGGSLVWVVGQDASVDHALHRVGGYNFGEKAGLYGKGSLWGCEAEVGVLCLEGRSDLAVNSHVTPQMAAAIGGLCRSIGVGVASPLQSFGSPVTLN